jgi:PncC family amidohydrolase
VNAIPLPEHLLLQRLAGSGLILATAESCSGGLIAHRITNVAGSSEYFAGGVVAYSNAVKTALLGVPEDLLERYGAVSDPVARAMAEGARTRLGAAIAVSVTGIAGPGGGTPEKPVGLVYIAVSGPHGVVVRECRFSGSREEIKQQTAETALRLLVEYLG